MIEFWHREDALAYLAVNSWINKNRIVATDLDMSRLSLRGFNFYRAIMEGCKMHNADLRGCDFYEANLIGADFSYADLRGCGFEWAFVKNLNVRNARVAGSYWHRARGMDFVVGEVAKWENVRTPK
jgi:uncharacterized protein YjbI with pentapeptide repeats